MEEILTSRAVQLLIKLDCGSSLVTVLLGPFPFTLSDCFVVDLLREGPASFAKFDHMEGRLREKGV